MFNANTIYIRRIILYPYNISGYEYSYDNTVGKCFCVGQTKSYSKINIFARGDLLERG